MDRLVKDYFCSFVFSSKKIILHCEYTQGRADNNWACFYKLIKMHQNLKLSPNTILSYLNEIIWKLILKVRFLHWISILFQKWFHSIVLFLLTFSVCLSKSQCDGNVYDDDMNVLAHNGFKYFMKLKELFYYFT